MKKTFTLIALLAAAAMLFANGLDQFKGKKGSIKIGGGTAHIPVMEEAARNINKVNKSLRISIAGGGSGAGIKQVGEGLLDIGNSGRKPTPKEISKHNLELHKWAIDGIAIVVNPKNNLQNLSDKQIQKVFSGEISNWKELGGKDKKINLYTRDASSGTRSVFWKKALKKGKISNKANFVTSNGAMKTAISNDPYAIGFVSVGHIDKSVKPLTFNGVAPSEENLISGKYTISRGLFSNTKGKAEGITKSFIDYLYTPEMQTFIKKKGFIPVSK